MALCGREGQTKDDVRRVTYKEALASTCRIANALKVSTRNITHNEHNTRNTQHTTHNT